MSSSNHIKGGKAVMEAIAAMELPLARALCQLVFKGKNEVDDKVRAYATRVENLYYYLFFKPIDIFSKIDESWSLFLFRREEDFNKFFDAVGKFTLTCEVPSIIKIALVDEAVCKIPTAIIYIASFEESPNT